MGVFSSGKTLPDLFLNPFTFSALSAAFHLGFFLLVSFLCIRTSCGRQRRRGGSAFSLYRTALLTSSSLGGFYTFLSGFSYYDVVYRSLGGGGSWSAAELALQTDLVTRAAAWVASACYLRWFLVGHYGSGSKRFPGFLRGCWVFFFVLSVAGLAADLVRFFDYRDAFGTPRTHVWVMDVGSLLFALLINYAGFFGGKSSSRVEAVADGSMEEPLLNGGVVPSSSSSSPFSTASFLSLATFAWVGPLLSLGYSKTLDPEDVPKLAEPDSAYTLVPAVRQRLESYAAAASDSSGDGDRSDRPSSLDLAKALFYANWPLMLTTGILALVNALASYVGPYLIDDLVTYLNGRQRFENEATILVSAFVVAKLVECVTQRHYLFRTQQIGVKFRATLVGLIYQKTLAVPGCPSGDTVNLVSVDADRLGNFSWYMHDVFIVPVQLALGLAIIYGNLGPSTFAGLGATALAMLANVPFAKMLEEYQGKLMEAKDARMKATTEVLRNMRVLKLQAWEMRFLSRIMELRQKEAGWLKKLAYATAMTIFLFSASPTFVAMATFGTCALVGVTLEAGKVLSAIAAFGVLQSSIIRVPNTVAMVIQTKVSLDRISAFLRLKNLPSDTVERLPMSHTNLAAVEISNGYFSWDSSPSSSPPPDDADNKTPSKPTLEDINLEVQRGAKVAVCGTVGSGKSSLLCSILGQMPKLSGKVKVRGSTAYVAQSPWIQSGTIEDNILFGKEMIRGKYEQVLEACALNKDLEMLPSGDQTLIGERGINLSGGQKQRIQIARALYQDADVYLFDDPFSAVDAHTGTHIFKGCLLDFLASKTVIYVTHQVEFLPTADLILVMKTGKISQAGKFDDILNLGTDFNELVGAHKKALSSLSSVQHGGNSVVDKPDVMNVEVSLNGDGKLEQAGNGSVKAEQKGQLVQEEERGKGRVGFSVYWKYITTAYNGFFVLPILLFEVLNEVLQVGSNYWMAWAAPVSKDSTPRVNVLTLIYVYVALAFGSSIFTFMSNLLMALVGYQTATLLFDKMHRCIFRAPMSFFDSTPSGRIINRASTNQSEVDTSLPNLIGWFAFSLIQLLGVIIVISLVAWQVFIIFIPVSAACIWYQQYYITTARELARLIGVCEAPVIQHVTETISGLITIRSFNQESRFINRNLHLIDAYSQPIFYNAGAMEWFIFRTDMLSSFTFTCSLIFLMYLPQGSIDPGIAGLAVTYGLTLNMLLSWVIWSLSNLENGIVSVERILQYSCIPSEPPLSVESNKPMSSWPSNGEIDIHNLQVSYAPHLPLVLKGVSCNFPGGKKTGIVGRTGSGKSTLIQTLFRLVDPTAGQIIIDGVDITAIGLHDLRSRLSIIPQDPTMFEGTIRSNLDPLEECSDDQIWEALDTCQLGEEVRKKDEKLDTQVTENGDNWSMGQRQLVCLARVILKKSKILVLDEATASVDTTTDSLIQQTLRQQFSDSTVITIAHRITSVLDSDMVVVLDNGSIAECGAPTELLKDKVSLFSKMVSEYTTRSISSSDQ